MWSKFQESIFEWIDKPDKTHMMIRAGAGCGKTTTIVEMFKRIQDNEPEASIQFLAFNKKIAEELNARKVPANTINSFGYRQVMRAFPGIKLNVDKVKNICKDLNIQWAEIGMVKRTVSLMKAYLTPLKCEPKAANDIITRFHLAEGMVRPELLKKICRVFRNSVEDCDSIDFDDQICFSVYHDLSVQQFDYMIVDEAQDLSPNKLELISRGVGEHFICVGDPLQAIYGFCGADSTSMTKIEAKFSPEVFPLPVTYRCGKRIVREVHEMNVAPHDFQAGETNHEGEVREVSQLVFETEVKAGDFVLCRMNAPNVKQCFNLIRRGVRSMILGRDIGASLNRLADKINEVVPTNPNENEIVSFIAKMTAYEYVEVKKFFAAEKEASAENLQDQIACLRVFVDNAKTFSEVKRKIETMFDDAVNPGVVTFSSIHKAKGLEADIVWGVPHPREVRFADGNQEESNLLYVQVTRAKKQFNWIQADEKGRVEPGVRVTNTGAVDK